MIERNADLRAFQERARIACGGEFATIQAFASSIGISRNEAYRVITGLRKIGRQYMVADMAERVFNELHPKPKRLG